MAVTALMALMAIMRGASHFRPSRRQQSMLAAMPAARRKRRTYHHGDLERALVDASIALLAKKGMDAFTLREVSRHVGVSHAAVYRHFADKSAMLEAIAVRGYQELTECLRAAIADVPRTRVEKRLLAIGVAYVMFALEQEPRFRVMTRPRREELRSPELDSAIDAALGVLIGVARDGVDTGVLRKAPPLDHAVRVYLLAYGYASLFLLGRLRVRPEKVESYLRSLMAPLVAALRTEVNE
ncbi:MAG TPA: TetR/AcrR family transcriptional regulator [Polyangiaceae bacterium]|jgi:AcrR family transcriptional regulator